MKRKFSKILGIGLTLALLASMLVMGSPVAASPDIDNLEVTVTPSVTDAEAYYKVIFQVHDGLQESVDSISVKFPAGTTVPATIPDGSIKISTDIDETDFDTIPDAYDSGPLNPTSVTVTDQTVEMLLPAFAIPVGNWVMVEFGGKIEQGNCTASAGIINPDTDDTYSLCTFTCDEPTEVLVDYDIIAPPGLVDIYLQYKYSEVEGDVCCQYRDYYMASRDTIPLALAYVDTTLYGEGEYTCYTCGETIPCPLDGVFYGAKLVVHDGDYDENVVIGPNTPCVTVESMNGASATTIDASAFTVSDDERPAAVAIAHVRNVTFGTAGKGFTIIAPDIVVGYDSYGIEVGLGVDCCTIEGNTITGNADKEAPKIGIHIWGSGPASLHNHTDLTIRDNIIDTTYTTVADWAHHSYGIISAPLDNKCNLDGEIIIDGNTVTGYSTGMYFYGIDCTELIPMVISNNTVKDSAYDGIVLRANVSTDAVGFVDVYDNEVYNNGGNGIAIRAPTTYVYRNKIYGNGNGVKVWDDFAETAIVRYNDIYSNTNTDLPADPDGNFTFTPYENYGVKNDADTTHGLDAKENYWGELGGPSCGPVPSVCLPVVEDQQSLALGNGDAVSHNVHYNPWLSVSYETVLADDIRFYGSDTLTLQAGWNTLSVPLALYTSADTLTEIEGLGSFLDDMVTAYAYDAAAGNWVVAPAVGDLELETGRGFYIKMDADMDADTKFPVLYSNQLGLPAFELAAGWNLIGSTFGIDKDNAASTDDNTDQGRFGVAPVVKHADDTHENEDDMLMAAALDSIGAQASVVVSPSVPGQIGDPWSVVYASTDVTTRMYTGDAYWVFMTGTGTLAGFEITPFYFTPDIP